MLKQNIHSHTSFDLKQLQIIFGGVFIESEGISILKFENALGKGNIKHVSLNNGLAVINFDVLLSENFMVDLGHPRFDVFHFIFCLKGLSSYSYGDSGVMKKLNELQSVVIESTYSSSNRICLKPNIKNIINIINVDKKKYFDTNTNPTNELKTKLESLFKSLSLDKKQIPIEGYNVKIGAYLKELLYEDEDYKITEHLHFEGLTHLMLASHIEALQKETLPLNKCELSETELKKIMDISTLIKDNPQEPFTISSLCKRTGLSPLKLQQGCKTINNRTISDFVRHVRIKKSEELLNTTDLNISEIVYSVGFTSRSYFCKIFKSEYGCTPKAYKKSLKS